MLWPRIAQDRIQPGIDLTVPEAAASSGHDSSISHASTIMRAMRPAQWLKNGIVFAGLVFGGKLLEPTAVASATLAALAFCALEQGRVQLDADWNEQQAINAHRRERLGIDVVGPSGAPQDDPGFGLALTADGSDLTIASGRYYVDGIACDVEPGQRLAFSSSGDNEALVALPRADLADFRAGQWLLLNVTAEVSQMLRITAVRR